MTIGTVPTRAAKRLALVAPDTGLVLDLLSGLVRGAIAARHKVSIIAGEAAPREAAKLASFGAEVHRVALNPPGLSFLSGRKALAAVEEVLAESEPHALLAAGGRAMALGALAGARLGVARIVTLPVVEPGTDAEAAGAAKAMSAAHAAVFLSEDDRIHAERRNVVPRGTPTAVLTLPGIDLAATAALPLPSLDDGPVFLFVGPRDGPGGAPDFIAAAREIRALSPRAHFVMAGEAGRGAEAERVEAEIARGGFELASSGDKLAGALTRAHVVVALPRLGLAPRVLLDALAAGRPVILTAVAGAGALVDERVNGCLVAAGDISGLTAAMAGFVRHPELIAAAARASRLKAERMFAGEPPAAALLKVLELT